MFRYTILVVVLGLQSMLFFKARRWLAQRYPAARWIRLALAALFIISNATLAIVLLAGRRLPDIHGWFLSLAAGPFYIWFGATIMLGLALLAGALIALPFKGLRAALRLVPAVGPRIKAVEAHPAVRRFDASRRVFLQRGMVGLTAASFGGAAYGVLGEKSDLRFTRSRFTIPGLPPPLEGFTIGMVSDVHSGTFMTKADMDTYVAALLSLKSDLIVVPGDFVNSMTEEVFPFAESFSALHAPCGVYGVMGNHDFFAPDPERVAREVDDCGVKLLRNDGVLIEKNGASFYLFGVDDAGRPERATALIGRATGNATLDIPRILLCHRPYFLPQAAAERIDLVLSGHTHGGQIVMGRVGGLTFTPAQFFSPYVWGQYSYGRTQMFVSRGIGTVGLPMRLNCPPEVALLTLSGS